MSENLSFAGRKQWLCELATTVARFLFAENLRMSEAARNHPKIGGMTARASGRVDKRTG
jgi:hypothetical protein